MKTKYLCNRYVELGHYCEKKDCPHFGLHDRMPIPEGVTHISKPKDKLLCSLKRYCEEVNDWVECISEKEISKLQSRKVPRVIPGTRGASGKPPVDGTRLSPPM